MAKAEVFKNKITKAQEDLFKALDTEKEKRTAIFAKIVAELAKQNKANVKSLNALNKEYVDLCKNNNLTLDEFIAKVNELNNVLQETTEQYKEVPNEEVELNTLKEHNENKKKTITNKFKREMQDVNIRIDRIEKELKEILEETKVTYESDVVAFRQKLMDLEKRKKFEVNKIQNNTIKEYDDLQAKLLKENKRSEIKQINKNIKQIRMNGLLEEKECWHRHLAEQKQAELEYLKLHYDYKCKCIELEKEYNNRIEDAKYDRAMIQHNYKKNIDTADNNVVHTFNQNMQKVKNQKNKDFETCYNNINQAYVDQYKYEVEKNNLETDNIKNIYVQIEELDKKQDAKLVELNGKGLTIVTKQLSLFQKNIVLTLNFYSQNINDIYKTYFKTLLTKEKDFVDSLVVNVVKGAFLNGNDYSEFVTKVEAVFNSFMEQEENILTSFSEYLNNALNNLLIQVQGFMDNVNKLNDQIIAIEANYHQSINAVLEEAKNKGIAFIENIKNETSNAIQNKVSENEQLFNSRCLEVKNTSDFIAKEFADREAAIKVIEDEQQATYLKDFNEIMKVRDDAKVEIEANYVKFANEYLADHEDKVLGLNEKFVGLRNGVEKEYKIKMGLL